MKEPHPTHNETATEAQSTWGGQAATGTERETSRFAARGQAWDSRIEFRRPFAKRQWTLEELQLLGRPKPDARRRRWTQPVCFPFFCPQFFCQFFPDGSLAFS